MLGHMDITSASFAGGHMLKTSALNSNTPLFREEPCHCFTGHAEEYLDSSVEVSDTSQMPPGSMSSWSSDWHRGFYRTQITFWRSFEFKGASVQNEPVQRIIHTNVHHTDQQP